MVGVSAVGGQWSLTTWDKIRHGNIVVVFRGFLLACFRVFFAKTGPRGFPRLLSTFEQILNLTRVIHIFFGRLDWGFTYEFRERVRWTGFPMTWVTCAAIVVAAADGVAATAVSGWKGGSVISIWVVYTNFLRWFDTADMRGDGSVK